MLGGAGGWAANACSSRSSPRRRWRVYASGLTSKLPDPKTAIGDIASALGPWTYALVGVLAFLETGAFIGLVAPGETVVIAGGVIARREIDLLPLIGLVWTCAVLGDTGFFIERQLGRRAPLEKHGLARRASPSRASRRWRAASGGTAERRS